MKRPTLALIAIACSARTALGDPTGSPVSQQERFPGLRPGQAVNVEKVLFANPQWVPVKVMRGPSRAKPGADSNKIGSPTSPTIVRVEPLPAPGPRDAMRIETV